MVVQVEVGVAATKVRLEAHNHYTLESSYNQAFFEQSTSVYGLPLVCQPAVEW